MRGYLEDLPLSGIGTSHVDVLEEVHGVQPGTREVLPPRDPCPAEGAVETQGSARASHERVVGHTQGNTVEEVLRRGSVKVSRL